MSSVVYLNVDVSEKHENSDFQSTPEYRFVARFVAKLVVSGVVIQHFPLARKLEAL
jgi:hypothetical protein